MLYTLCACTQGKLGEVLLSLCYQPTVGRITVVIIKARELKAKDINGLSGTLCQRCRHGNRNGSQGCGYVGGPEVHSQQCVVNVARFLSFKGYSEQENSVSFYKSHVFVILVATSI